MYRAGIVAGETSGDALASGLIEALRTRAPGMQFAGVAGPQMQAAGCEVWSESDELAVMGLLEVIAHLPRLLRLRRRLHARLLAERPDVFIGVDAPEFNLPLAGRLRAAGMPTVHYVSPQVWAWREGRLRHIAQAVDLMLCLFPFEKAFYDAHGVAAEFVGHPLADEIPLDLARAPARASLGLPADGRLVAVLPGSRRAEVRLLGPDFAAAMAILARQRPELRFVAPMARPVVRELFAGILAEHAPGVPVTLLDGNARQALAAADVVLVASGTATLETLLVGRPMVVAARVARGTSWLLRSFKLLKVERISLPNLLAGEALVPELVQEQVTPEALAAALAVQLDDPSQRTAQREAFADIHRTLRRNASNRAADAVLGLLGQRPEAANT